MSGNLIPEHWLEAALEPYLRPSPFLSLLGGDPERIAELRAKDEARVAEYRANHVKALAEATGRLRDVIELHGPAFYGDTDRYPHCSGCEVSGYEADHPDFPCETYVVATGLYGGAA